MLQEQQVCCHSSNWSWYCKYTFIIMLQMKNSWDIYFIWADEFQWSQDIYEYTETSELILMIHFKISLIIIFFTGSSYQMYYLLSGCSCVSLLVISVSAMTWHLNGDASRQNVKALNCLIAYAFASQKCNVFFLSCLFSSLHFLLLNWTCLCACEILYNILV